MTGARIGAPGAQEGVTIPQLNHPPLHPRPPALKAGLGAPPNLHIPTPIAPPQLLQYFLRLVGAGTNAGEPQGCA